MFLDLFIEGFFLEKLIFNTLAGSSLDIFYSKMQILYLKNNLN